MFERSEAARRSLFFGRANSADRNALTPEDLLAGMLVAAPESVRRFASDPSTPLLASGTPDEFLARMDHPEWRMRASREIRFAPATRGILERAIQEADALGHQDVTPEHLLLGLLRDEQTDAWRTLRGVEVTLREVRRALASAGTRGSDENP